MRKFINIFSLLLLGSTASYTQEVNLKLDIGGFIRTDYGNGDRYSKSGGEDTLGVSKAALAVKGKYQNVDSVFVIGTENMTNNTTATGDVTVKDAFLVWKDIAGSKFKLSVGAQPILFGLKPNGYPGDRSLQGSIEYGGAGAFAVSNQAGPSIIAHYDFTPVTNLSFGAFDTDETTSTPKTTDGSTLSQNLFAQIRSKDFFIKGLYGAIGYENRYVGATIDSSKPIFDIGLGFKNTLFDLSYEYIALDKNITNTTDDERYHIVELTVNPTKKLSLMLDWANADELNVDTIRAGFVYWINDRFDFHAEYSKDDPDVGNSVDSIDLRLTFSF